VGNKVINVSEAGVQRIKVWW